MTTTAHMGDSPQASLERKRARLEALISELGSVVLGLSGGVDSSLLAKASHDVLGDRALAVIARSASLPARELAGALEVAEGIGISVEVVDTAEVDDPRYRSNPRNRCYFCKDELFAHLHRLAAERGFSAVAYGENADDSGDHRPGRAAALANNARAPLAEAGLSKQDVRGLARQLDLPVWDKPEFACLASRFPHGHEITEERLGQVERAEDALAALGLRQLRVRHHEDLARIEVPPDELPKVVAVADEAVAALRACGFGHVTLDLAGYRRGGSDRPAGQDDAVVPTQAGLLPVARA